MEILLRHNELQHNLVWLSSKKNTSAGTRWKWKHILLQKEVKQLLLNFFDLSFEKKQAKSYWL